MIYLLFLLTGFAQNPTWNVDENGVAIYGYDPVSYFNHAPTQGSPTLTYQYDNAIFYFSNGENLSSFSADPEAYLPAFGGFCAYTMGTNGTKADINPEAYKISDGKLLLFDEKDALTSWNAKERRLLKKARGHWKAERSVTN